MSLIIDEIFISECTLSLLYHILCPGDPGGLHGGPPVHDRGLETNQHEEGDDESQNARVKHKSTGIRIYWRHAPCQGSVFDCSFVHQVMEIREARSINIHGGGDEESYQPGGHHHDGHRPDLPLSCVPAKLEAAIPHQCYQRLLKRMEDSIVPVNADTNETIDAGRAECDICADKHHAAAHSKHPAIIQHLQH